jgi:thiol-disulfide isomerase/thioredoxin
MQRLALLFLICLALAGCGKGSARQPVASNDPPPAVSRKAGDTPEPARDFTLQTLDGGSVTLSDLQGEWVLVNFWATWCAPCVAEMAYLEEVHQTRAINVLGINYNEAPKDVQKFVDEHGVTFPILLEPDDVLKMVYEARALPRTVVVAPDGRVVNRTLGQLRPESFDAWLDANDVPLR